jgi:hypothetical protein
MFDPKGHVEPAVQAVGAVDAAAQKEPAGQIVDVDAFTQ